MFAASCRGAADARRHRNADSAARRRPRPSRRNGKGRSLRSRQIVKGIRSPFRLLQAQPKFARMYRSNRRRETDDQADIGPERSAKCEGGEIPELHQTNEYSDEKYFGHVPTPGAMRPTTKNDRAGQPPLIDQRNDEVKQADDDQCWRGKDEDRDRRGEVRISLLSEPGDALPQMHLALADSG